MRSGGIVVIATLAFAFGCNTFEGAGAGPEGAAGTVGPDLAGDGGTGDGAIVTGAGAKACPAGTWSDSGKAEPACAPWTTCEPGKHVVVAPGTSADRTCAPCAAETFSASPNAPSCTAWTACEDGFEEKTAGTETTDRTCKASAWARQLCENGGSVRALALDGVGNVYIGGYADGALPGQTAAGAHDAFVRKYSPSGKELWTREFGTPGDNDDQATSIAVSAQGDVYVVGYVGAALPGQTHQGGSDVFLRKYDPAGTELWTRQFGTNAADSALALVLDISGAAYVVGRVGGTLPGQTSMDQIDAFVRKYDAAGTELWTRQFGTNAADKADAVLLDASGNIYVGGGTDGTFPGQTNTAGHDRFLRKYDASGTELWTHQFGSKATQAAYAVRLDAAGNQYFVGTTTEALPAKKSAGGRDAFVSKYDVSGTEIWTRQFGSMYDEEGDSLTLDPNGHVFVVGNTQGMFPGLTDKQGPKGFVREYDTSGTEISTIAFGPDPGGEYVSAIARDVNNGITYAGGNTYGKYPGQSCVGGGFVVRLVP